MLIKCALHSWVPIPSSLRLFCKLDLETFCFLAKRSLKIRSIMKFSLRTIPDQRMAEKLVRTWAMLDQCNSLLFIQNISSFLKEFRHYALCFSVFPLTKYNTTSSQVFSVNGSIICGGLHFWCHLDVIGSIIFDGLHFWRHWFNMAKILSNFGEQQLVMVNYACGKIFWMSNKMRYWTMQTLPIVITLSHLRALHDALRETFLKVTNI